MDFNEKQRIFAEKGIYIKKPDPLNLQFRKKVSFLEDKFTEGYLKKFAYDMAIRFRTPVVKMSDDDLIYFAVKYLSDCEDYLYFYIYNNDEIIGEIYAYSCEKNNSGYFFNIYIVEKYRNQANYIDAIKAFQLWMFGVPRHVKRLYIDVDSDYLDSILKHTNFSLKIEFDSGERRFISEEYMFQGMSLEKPSLEHEEKYLKYLKNCCYSSNEKFDSKKWAKYKNFDYKKWLKTVENGCKEKAEYFLMYYNYDLKDTEIVGVGYILRNWKKENCISYEIEKRREMTDFGKYFFRMLFNKLHDLEDEDFFEDTVTCIEVSCPKYDYRKIDEYMYTLKNLNMNVSFTDYTIHIRVVLKVF